MKTAEKLKERDLEPQFEALLQELLGRVPFLKLKSLRRDAPLAPSRPERPDWLAKVRAGERRSTLVVEGRRIGQPRRHVLDWLCHHTPQRVERLPFARRQKSGWPACSGSY